MSKNFFTVRYAIFTNREGVHPHGRGMSRSLSKAMACASAQAWNQYERSTATNWADCWVWVYKGGTLVAQGFEGELQPV